MSIWTDLHFQAGTQLQPQHFQLLQRNLSARAFDRTAPAAPFQFGLVAATVDAGALNENKLRFSDLHARLPSGLVVIQGGNADVADFDLSGLPVNGGPAVLHLVVAPPVPPGHSGLKGAPGLATAQVPDETTGGDPRPVLHRRHQVHLSRHPPANGEESLPVCQIDPRPLLASQPWTPNAEFTPPCMVIQANAFLKGTVDALERLFRLTFQCLRATASPRESAPGLPLRSLREMLAGQTCARASNLLQCLRSLPHRGTPWEAFVELRGALHELCAILPTTEALDDHAYDHMNPGPCFARLKESIVPLLNSLRDVELRAIPFVAAPGSRPAADLKSLDANTLGDAWIVVKQVKNAPALKSFLGDNTLFKLMAKSEEHSLVSGVLLKSVACPPMAGTAQEDGWFRVENQLGDRWQSILKCQTAVLMWGDVKLPELRAQLGQARFELVHEVNITP